jgi:NADH-quinone oxidoreductase subunit C
MTTKLETLEAALRNALGSQIQDLTVALGEITVVVKAPHYLSACACCAIMPICVLKN